MRLQHIILLFFISTQVNQSCNEAKKIKPVEVLSTQRFYINSTLNEIFKGGQSKVTVEITLPENTIEWYYAFSANRINHFHEYETTFNLLSYLTYLFDPSGALKEGVQVMTEPPGANICNVYLFESSDRSSFFASSDKNNYQYIPMGTRENFFSGIVKMTDHLNGSYVIGLMNPDLLYGIHVTLEVVALVKKDRSNRTN